MYRKPRLTIRIGRDESTAGKRWRLRRNVAIAYLAEQGGFSHRYLADVFDLPRSSIPVIVEQVRDHLAAKIGLLEKTQRGAVPETCRNDRRRKPAPRRGA